MSPRGSLPTTPAPSYLRSLSPLAQRADLVGLATSTVMDEQPSIRSLLDIQGKLPLPGQLEDEDVTISSAMLVQATRSDSADSISSVLNDLGHDTTLQHDQAVHHEDEEDTTAGIPMYNGSAFIQDVNAPPLQPLPMSLPVAVERALPMPPAKNASDPPLIPSLRRPDLMHLAGEASMSQQRPVSPFSPTLSLYSEHVRQASASYDKIILTTAARKETSDPDQDLINFDSDDETSVLPEMHDQYAQYQMEDCSDSVYFSQQSQRQRQYSSSSYGQENDNDAESVSSSNEEEEEEDYSSHALYSTLSTSESPYVRKAWEGSKIVLVPSRHSLPQAFMTSSKQYNANTSLDNPEEWERFTALHALRQQGSTASPETSSMTYIGYGETVDGMRFYARLDSENRQVQISLRQAELASPAPSPLQTIPSTSASAQAFDEFGMTIHPASQPLSRHAASSSSVSTHSGAIPPHLLVSSPTASIDSGNFPTTPPISSEMSASMPSTSKGSSGAGSTPRIPPAVAFPSVEQQQVPGRQYSQNPLSPTRRLNIVHEKIIYRKRRVKSNVSTSAPSALPSPPPMSRNDSSISASSSAAAASQVNSVQQAAERLSKLSTPSMQSISSLASVATTNNGRSVKKKDSKVRLRVPKWLGGRNKDTNTGPLSAGLKITESAPSTPVAPQAENRQAATTTTTIQEEIQLIIEKVRLIQVDSYVVPWPGEEVIISPVTSSRDLRKSLPLSARRSQQTFASGARMHRNSSQPLGSAQSLSLSIHPSQQDATVKERKSFQHPPFSATLAEESNSAIPYATGDDMNAASSVKMSSRHDSNASRSSRTSKRSSSALRMKHTSQASSSQEMTRDFSRYVPGSVKPHVDKELTACST